MMNFAKIILMLILIFFHYGCATDLEEVVKGELRGTAESTEEQAYRIGLQAYVYGYPLVLTEVTRKAIVQRSGINQFIHAQAFPTAAHRLVVRSNVDTLYSSAWLDLSREPMVLSVPNTGGRYYVMQMMDAWTETFALLGKRTTGTQAGHFVIVGPNWQGPLPSNVEVIKAPTNMVWICGRTQTNGISDYENVHAVQRGYRLTPLGPWVRNVLPAPGAPLAEAVDRKTLPPVQVARMDAAAFFTAFARLLKDNRPHPEDTNLVTKLKAIGLEPGKAFDIKQLGPGATRGLDRAVQEGRKLIARPGREGSIMRNGWNISVQNVGRYGTAYLDRAHTARFGLGALPREEAVYPHTAVDGAGSPLSGTNGYVVHFDKDKLPPVHAFWSVTLYDAEGYFWPNPLERYALGDRDKLQHNLNGSLDIYIQHVSPGKNRETNWLPSPFTPFTLTLRLYWPKPEVLSGEWMPPAVHRVY